MKAIHACPNCSSDKTAYYGKYKRKRSRQLIQRYKCTSCGKTFSDQTLSKTYKQKRPDLNQKILEGLGLGMGIRKIALKYRTTKNTVQKRVKFLADICDKFQKKYMTEWDVKPQFQFDEMETYEHSSHATLGIPVIVEKKSHFIIGAIGQYIRSRSQYPPLRDKHNFAHSKEISAKERIIKEQLNLCRYMKPQGRIVIDTDKHKSYPKYMEDVFGQDVVHIQYKSDDETENQRLFPVNNICGCLRADVAMLRRDTWHGCKDKDMLTARLKIYTFISNYFKKKEYSRTWKDDLGKKHKTILSVETPAMKLGILDAPVGCIFLLNHT